LEKNIYLQFVLQTFLCYDEDWASQFSNVKKDMTNKYSL